MRRTHHAMEVATNQSHTIGMPRCTGFTMISVEPIKAIVVSGMLAMVGTRNGAIGQILAGGNSLRSIGNKKIGDKINKQLLITCSN